MVVNHQNGLVCKLEFGVGLLEVPVFLISSIFLRSGRSGRAKILKTAL